MARFFDQHEYDLHKQALIERAAADGVSETELDREITRARRYFWMVRCDCGRTLAVPNFTNTCECGADYNSSGQRLAARSQWGEETGETADDIIQYEAAGFPETGPLAVDY